MNKKIIAWGLLATLLSTALFSCGKADDATKENEGASKEVVTIIRTKTPQLDFDEDNYLNHGSIGRQEKGDGLELDGYRQLLDDIDRSSFQAPAGWDRHPINDLFDGIFETTDQGTNKYGTNESSFTIEWEMDDPCVLEAYTVVTASDAESYPDRNPQQWTISASRDGERWVELHSIRTDLPAQNYTPVTFYFENSTAYSHYRWTIESTVGGGMFQASELLLYEAD